MSETIRVVSSESSSSDSGAGASVCFITLLSVLCMSVIHENVWNVDSSRWRCDWRRESGETIPRQGGHVGHSASILNDRSRDRSGLPHCYYYDRLLKGGEISVLVEELGSLKYVRYFQP